MAGVKDRVALVTGAGRGIGRATATILAERGAHVMAVARSENELRELGLDYVAADLGTAPGCAMAVEETLLKFGVIDIFVCNHGIGSAHEKVIWEQDPATWEETIRINLDGPFHLSRLVTAGMVRRRYGRIVYTSSTAGDVAEYAGSAYTAAKHGLIGLAKAVAQDCWEFNVTSNAVLPGWVKTAMADRSAAAEAKQRGIDADQVWQERAALYRPNRVATPREVAETIAFLASEEAGGVSAQAIKVALGAQS